MKTLHFDCFSGVSGDMMVGALLDAGASFERLETGLKSLGVPGFHITAEKVVKKGVTATQFGVHVDSSEKPHRHLRHILEIIEGGDLPAQVKEASAATFRRIAEAEAAVHGTTVEKVHFHEVGALDSIVDVIGAHLALYDLGVRKVTASPLALGGGQVKCGHGLMPVPAPATALLVKDIPSYGGGVDAELTTPTGAALIAQMARGFGPMPSMTPETVGYGSGTRDLPDRPNVLRALLGKTDEAGLRAEPIVVIESTLDDMSPELYPPLIGALMDCGARDAFLTPVQGKKGRPGHLVTVLCDETQVEAVTQALFANSTTLGLRMRTESRYCLERSWEWTATPWGEVRMKIGHLNGQPHLRQPEYEDCRQRAEEAGVPVRTVYAAALAAAVREDAPHA